MNVICEVCHRRPDDCICAEMEEEHNRYSEEGLDLAHFLWSGLATDMIVVRTGSARGIYPDTSDEVVTEALKHLVWHIEKVIKEPIPDVRWDQ